MVATGTYYRCVEPTREISEHFRVTGQTQYIVHCSGASGIFSISPIVIERLEREKKIVVGHYLIDISHQIYKPTIGDTEECRQCGVAVNDPLISVGCKRRVIPPTELFRIHLDDSPPAKGEPMSETPQQRRRREQRGVALARLQELATLAMRSFPDDLPSQDNILEMHRTVMYCLEQFEGEANAVEAQPTPPASLPHGCCHDPECSCRLWQPTPPAEGETAIMAGYDEAERRARKRAGGDTGKPVCRVCGGYGFVAQKQTIDDGYGEVDSCPACDEREGETAGLTRWVIDNIYTIARRESRREQAKLRPEMWGHVLRLCERLGAAERTVGVLRAEGDRRDG